MTDPGYWAVHCENEECGHWFKTDSKDSAITGASLGCPRCYGDARPYRFEPMIGDGKKWNQGVLFE